MCTSHAQPCCRFLNRNFGTVEAPLMIEMEDVLADGGNGKVECFASLREPPTFLSPLNSESRTRAPRPVTYARIESGSLRLGRR